MGDMVKEDNKSTMFQGASGYHASALVMHLLQSSLDKLPSGSVSCDVE